jgi:hypothetical protein
MLDALVLGSVKMVKAVTEKPPEENGTSAVFVPLSETPAQPEVSSPPKDPVLNDLKEKPVEQPVAAVPTSVDNAVSLTKSEPQRIVSEPIKLENKQELPAPSDTNSAITIEMPSQPNSHSPSTEGSNEGKEQPKAPEAKPKRRGLWGYMG